MLAPPYENADSEGRRRRNESTHLATGGRDINAIWDYIARDSPGSADRVEQSIHDAIEHLAEHPNSGHFRDDVVNRRYRFYLVYSYLIIYRIHHSTLFVVRVVHGA